jgi:hypothetical protein
MTSVHHSSNILKNGIFHNFGDKLELSVSAVNNDRVNPHEKIKQNCAFFSQGNLIFREIDFQLKK